MAEERVRAWLSTKGIPFEADVAAAFRSAGFEVFQGIHYRPDSDEAEGGREIDVLAVREELVTNHPMSRCTVVYVVECKTAKSPWVAIRGTRDAEKWGAVGRFPMNGLSEMNLLGALEWDHEPRVLALPPDSSHRVMATWAPNEAARAEAAPRRTGDAAYNAVRQVLSAAEGLLRADPAHLPTVAIPVIAISSSLFAATFVSGEAQLEPVGWERVAWRGARDARVRVFDVVSGDAVSRYAEEAWAGAGELLPLLRAAMIVRRQEEMDENARETGRLDHLFLNAEGIVDALRSRIVFARDWLRSRVRGSRG